VFSLIDAAGYTAFKAALILTQRRPYRRLIDASKTPREVQEILLRRIVTANADTEFGHRHGFSRVADMAGYRTAVPVQTYENLRPFIERQDLTRQNCLTAEQPVYYLPFQGERIDAGLRHAQKIAGFRQFKTNRLHRQQPVLHIRVVTYW